MNTPSALLIGMAAGFAGLIALALLLLRLDAANKKREQRIAAVVQPHWRAAAPPRGREWVLPRLLRGRIGDILHRLTGFHIDRVEDYPNYWWLVVILALPVARVATGLLATLVGEWLLWLAPVLWLILVRGYFSWLQEQRLETLFRQFPDALAMIVRSVRVGIPVSEAIRTVARDSLPPTAREFQRMADRLMVGMPLNEALAETAARVGLPEYRFFATALALQAQTGGGLTDTLENLAEVIRKRVALKARAAALSAEAKTSAGVLAALPFFAGGALLLLSPDYILMLVNERQGQQVLGAAVLMLTFGILVMRSMIRRALRA